MVQTKAPSGRTQLYSCPNKCKKDFSPQKYEELVSVFTKYDTDNSQTLERHEIPKLLNDCRIQNITIDRAMEMMEAHSEDSDGTIDFEEFFFSWHE